MLFPGTRQKISQQVNDRITAPVRTSVIISLTALLIAGIALVMTVNRASH